MHPTVAKLVRLIARAFYSDESVLVLDALAEREFLRVCNPTHKATPLLVTSLTCSLYAFCIGWLLVFLQDSELSQAFGLKTRQVRRIMRTLELDHLVQRYGHTALRTFLPHPVYTLVVTIVCTLQ